jgi:hypothetical protein
MGTIILRAAHDACSSPDVPLRERETADLHGWRLPGDR